MFEFFYPQAVRDLFTNRIAILDQLIAAFTEAATTGRPQHLALFGPRRIGKTLLLKELIARLGQQTKDIIPVYLDFQELCAAPETFVTGFIGQIYYWLYEQGRTNPQRYFHFAHVQRQALEKQDRLAAKIVEEVQSELDKAQPDRHYLLTLAFNFPQELALSQGKHLLLIFDEFQTVQTLNNYPGVENVLALFRAALQRQGAVSYLLAGSAVTIMTTILSDHRSPLFAQFDKLTLTAFDADHTRELAGKLLPEGKNPDAFQEIHRLTGGNPFYIVQLCRRIKILAQTLPEITPSLVQMAFIIECLSKEGKIYDYCRYVYDISLRQASGYGALQNILRYLAQEEGQTNAMLARRLKVSHQTAREYLRALQNVDLVVEQGKKYYFADPVLRYWVAQVGQGIELDYLPSPELLQELIPQLVEQFHRVSAELGSAKESEIRELVLALAGNSVPGRLLGCSVPTLMIPCFRECAPYRSKDGQVEIECLATAEETKWAVEVKWRVKVIGVKEVTRFYEKSRGFAEKGWFISRSGFTEEARRFCQEKGIYYSDARDLSALRKAIRGLALLEGDSKTDVD